MGSKSRRIRKNRKPKVPKGMGLKPRRRGKAHREMDPIKLVMARGTNMEKRRRPLFEEQEDEDGNTINVPTGLYEMADAAVPMGVVLGPVQTMVLAGFLQQQQERIQQLDQLVRETLGADGSLLSGPTSEDDPDEETPQAVFEEDKEQADDKGEQE